MELTKKLTQWVEMKIGSIINNELKEKIQLENSSFNINEYVNDLLTRFFNDEDIEILKKEIEHGYFQEHFNDLESDNSTEAENSYDFLDLEPNEFSILPLDEILKNLQNTCERINIKYLQVLEVSAEDLISQKSWNVVKKILQNLLEVKTDREILVLVLKIFQKFLMCCSKPQLVCEGFLSLTEVVSLHVEIINSCNSFISYEEIYDLKENKFLNKNVLPESTESSSEDSSKNIRPARAEVLIKSMWLLLECQKQMPEKWIRFSERRLREIIFSFIHLLYSTTCAENEKLSGLELVSILNPTASWCRHWCHTTVGRTLLCSALRKYRNFFIHIVEIILSNMTTKRIYLTQTINNNTITSRAIINYAKSKSNKESVIVKNLQKPEKENKLEEKYLENERNKYTRSAPAVSTKRSLVGGKKFKSSSRWLVENIPQKVVTQAKFFHCMNLIVCLIQFRSGRSLFPVQTTYRKRLLSVGDLVLSMVNYLENFDSVGNNIEHIFKDTFKKQVSQILETLKNAENSIPSLRMSAERFPLSQR